MVQYTAPNGVTFTRYPNGTTSGDQLQKALDSLTAGISQEWNWWQEGREKEERAYAIVSEWDNGAPKRDDFDREAYIAELDAQFDKKREADKQRRARLVATSYDKDQEHARLRLLATESDIAFMGHVVAAPASEAQRAEAEQRMTTGRADVDQLQEQLGGNPEQIIDNRGYLPSERRDQHLNSHMRYWRHPMLRELAKAKGQRQRFNTLLKMPMPEPSAMCSECEAPAEWHEYAMSLCLFRGTPEPGSQAETLARLMPSWWERCFACTDYKVRHHWGGSQALPDFTFDQWRSILPPGAACRVRARGSETQPKAEAKPSVAGSHGAPPAEDRRRSPSVARAARAAQRRRPLGDCRGPPSRRRRVFPARSRGRTDANIAFA